MASELEEPRWWPPWASILGLVLSCKAEDFFLRRFFVCRVGFLTKLRPGIILSEVVPASLVASFLGLLEVVVVAVVGVVSLSL